MWNPLKNARGEQPVAPEVSEAAALLEEVRQEKAQVTALLDRLKSEARMVKQASTVLGRIQTQMDQADQRMNDVSSRLASVETVAASAASLTAEVNTLGGIVRDAEQGVSYLLSPDGELYKQRALLQQMTSQSAGARAMLDNLSKEQSSLEALRMSLRLALDDLNTARDRVVVTAATVEPLSQAVTAMKTDIERVREIARE